jgi:MYXO-CTERM domain-containing protein
MLACACWLSGVSIVVVGLVAAAGFFAWRNRRRRAAADRAV